VELLWNSCGQLFLKAPSELRGTCRAAVQGERWLRHRKKQTSPAQSESRPEQLTDRTEVPFAVLPGVDWPPPVAS
jgi:hypothetical protein